MNNLVEGYELFDKVVSEYGSNPMYQNEDGTPNMEKIRDEAIGKLIAREIVDQHNKDEDIEKLGRFKRWFAKVMNAIKKMFGGVFKNPYQRAAYQMLNTSIKEYKDISRSIQSTDQYLQQENPSTEVVKPVGHSQQDIVDSILRDHNNIKMRAIDKTDLKLSKVITEQDDDLTMNMYEYTDPETGQTHTISKRVSFRNAANFARKFRYDMAKIKEINGSVRSIHARNNGTHLHGVSQMLAEYYGSRSNAKFVEVIDTSGEGIKSIGDIKTFANTQIKIGETPFNNLKKGVSKVIQQINKEQERIDPKGKAKILTEAVVYDRLNDEAGTIDLLVVFSDGSTGIFDWKFIVNPAPRYNVPKRYGDKTKLADKAIFESKMDGWNTQISAYKQMLSKIHGSKKVRFTRIIPAHAQFAVKNYIKKDFTPINKVEAIMMGRDQNEILDQISVALEQTDYKGINKLLEKFYDKRRNLKIQLRNVKGKKKVKFEKLRSEAAKVEQTIQALTVQRNVMDVILNAGRRIALIGDKVGISDPTHPDYLELDDLVDALEDLATFEELAANTAIYLKDLRSSKDAEIRKSAAAIQKAVDRATGIIERNVEVIKQGMFDRLTTKADKMDGEDLTESPKELGFFDRNGRQMSQMPHPIFRVGYNRILKSFNKIKGATEGLKGEEDEPGTIMHELKLLKNWSKSKYGKESLQKAYRMMIKDNIVKDEKGKETILSRTLAAKFGSDFYQSVRQKIADRDAKWMRENFKIKEDANEIYKRQLELKRAFEEIHNADVFEIDDETGKKKKVKDNANLRKENIKRWELNNNIFLPSDEAWLKSSWWFYLEPKNPEENYSKEFKELNKPGNEGALRFYNFYKENIQRLADVAGIHLDHNFIPNVKDGLVDSIINNPFNMSEFFDSISRAMVVHEEQEDMGIYNDGKLVSQIPLLYTADMRNSKGELDASLKSIDLASSLFAMSKSVYTFKYMNEIEAELLALKTYLANVGETQTNLRGKIVLKEDGSIKIADTSSKTIDTYEKFVKFYLYGQKIQSKDHVAKVFGRSISLNKTVQAAMSYYSARTLGLSLTPAFAARIIGGINMWVDSVDGMHYNRKQLRKAHRLWMTQGKMVRSAAVMFDPFQQGMQWRHLKDLSMKKISKYLDANYLYTFLRGADENMDSLVAISMMQNYTIDTTGSANEKADDYNPDYGQIKRMEDMPEGAVSLLDQFEESYKKGSIMIKGLTDENFMHFREMIKEVAGKQKGHMSNENVIAGDLTLIGHVMMHFKGFFPKMFETRLGPTRFNRVLKEFEEGRYWGFLKGSTYGDTFSDADAIKSEIVFGDIIKGAARRGAEAFMHFTMLKKFITNPIERQRLIDKGKWTDKMQASYEKKQAAIEKEFKHLQENSTDPRIKSMGIKEFMKMRQKSVNRTFSELRWLFGFYLVSMGLGMGVGPDDEPIGKSTWAGRKLYLLLSRSQNELAFLMNPNEFVNMVKSPFPILQLFKDITNLVENTQQETLELLGLIPDNPRDKTPMFYRTLHFVPGFSHANYLFEFYSTGKNNPYTGR